MTCAHCRHRRIPDGLTCAWCLGDEHECDTDCPKTPYGGGLRGVRQAVAKLKRTFDGDSNDAEHDAALDLIDALQTAGIIHWEAKP